MAGDFTRVNGETHVGTVVINPSTGQVDPSWDLSITNALNGGQVSVRALDYYDGNVYLGGVFTHLSGGGSSKVYGRNAARVSLDGRPDRSWNPELSGSVQAVPSTPADTSPVHTAPSAPGTRRSSRPSPVPPRTSNSISNLPP